MEVDRKQVYHRRSILSKQIDIKFIALFSMFIIYPLFVMPNRLGYFYFPRYIMLGFVSILCLLSIIKEKEIKLLLLYLPLSLYLLCIVISSLTAINIETAFLGLFGIQGVPVSGQDNTLAIVSTARFTGFVTIICCVILYLTAYKTGKSDKLISSMVIIASIVGFVALLQHFGLNIVPHESFRDKYPPYGTIGQHNFLATYMVFILPAAIYKFIKSRKKLWLPCIALIYSGLLVSTTRGAWIALAISIVVMCIYYLRNKQFRKPFIIAIAVMAIVTVILIGTDDGYIKKRALSILTNVSSGIQLEDSAGSGRLFIWKNVIKLIPDNWAFGVGPDNLIYAGIRQGPNAFTDKAHNIYLETAVTMGIPALVFYLAFLSFFIVRRWRTDKDFMFFSMISTYLIQGFFNIDVIMVLPLFWIILGLYQAEWCHSESTDLR